MKEGFPGLNSMRYLNTQYPILDRWDWKQLLVTYSHSPGKEDMAHHAGPHRGCTQELREPGGTGEVGFVVTRMQISPSFIWEDVIGLFE